MGLGNEDGLVWRACVGLVGSTDGEGRLSLSQFDEGAFFSMHTLPTHGTSFGRAVGAGVAEHPSADRRAEPGGRRQHPSRTTGKARGMLTLTLVLHGISGIWTTPLLEFKHQIE